MSAIGYKKTTYEEHESRNLIFAALADALANLRSDGSLASIRLHVCSDNYITDVDAASPFVCGRIRFIHL